MEHEFKLYSSEENKPRINISVEPEQGSDLQNILSREIHKGSRIQPAAQLAAHGKERRGRRDDKQEGAQKMDTGKTWEHVLNWLGCMKSGEKTK